MAWDAKQAAAYCRAVLLTLESYLLKDRWTHHSYALIRSINIVENISYDVYKLNDTAETGGDISDRLRVSVNFVKDAVELLQRHMPLRSTLRKREGQRHLEYDLFDEIADLMFEIIFAAAAVRGPFWTCWHTQHNTVWSEFFGVREGRAWSIVRFKLRRLLYDEIRQLERVPNFKSSRILGLCLNVLAFPPAQRLGHDLHPYPIQKAIVSWTSANYARLRRANPDVAENCLVSRMSFDEEGSRLVKTYEKNLHRVAPKEYLDVVREDSRNKGAASDVGGD